MEWKQVAPYHQFYDIIARVSPPSRGACCLPDGNCLEQQTREQCDAKPGEWKEDLTCQQANCPQPPPEGACCLKDGACEDGLTESGCSQKKGVQWHEGKACDDIECPPPGGCNGKETISKAKCKTKRGAVKKAIVLMKNGTPGEEYTATLDTGQKLTKKAKGSGKAKFTFKGGNKPPCGANAVTISTAGDDCVAKDFGCNCN